MRIKVTGYLDTDDMSPEDVDTGHEMGVSESFHDRILLGQEPLWLSDVEFKAEA